jgi:hypothetical protein
MLVLVEFSSTLTRGNFGCGDFRNKLAGQFSRGNAFGECSQRSFSSRTAQQVMQQRDRRAWRTWIAPHISRAPVCSPLRSAIGTYVIISAFLAWIANRNQQLGYRPCVDGKEESRTLGVNQFSDNVDLSPLQHRRGACRPLFLS